MSRVPRAQETPRWRRPTSLTPSLTRRPRAAASSPTRASASRRARDLHKWRRLAPLPRWPQTTPSRSNSCATHRGLRAPLHDRASAGALDHGAGAIHMHLLRRRNVSALAATVTVAAATDFVAAAEPLLHVASASATSRSLLLCRICSHEPTAQHPPHPQRPAAEAAPRAARRSLQARVLRCEARGSRAGGRVDGRTDGGEAHARQRARDKHTVSQNRTIARCSLSSRSSLQII